MSGLRVLTIIGTRPEAIKMAPVINALRGNPGQIEVLVCATGQHRDMLDQVLNLFEIRPDFDLDLMKIDQSLSQIAAGVLDAVDPLLTELAPDWILVQGDTTTVMAAAIAAHHRRVKVGHVEAGLRTYDRSNPFPEEMNRVVTDHISDLHFAPTIGARDNLLREGIPEKSIFVTGNTVIDALEWVSIQPPGPEAHKLLQELGFAKNGKATDNHRSLVLVTAHRRENFGEPLRRICQALIRLTEGEKVHLIYPVHRNPNVWHPVHELLGSQPNITLIPPVDYLTLVHLIKQSRIILTDSGGIQEEAPSLGVPVLVLRETTERPEAVDAGAARIVGTNPTRIFAEAHKLLNDPSSYSEMAKAINPYGDGKASLRIADVLLHGKCEPFAP